MSDVILSNQDSGPRELAPAGLQNAICAFVEDMGEEWSEKYNKASPKLVLIFELEEKMSDGRPFMASKTYTKSMNEKANLRRELEGWRGKKFTEEELRAFNLTSAMRRAPCTLNLMHVPSKSTGKVYCNIMGILPKQKHAPALSVQAEEPPKWVAERREKNKQDMAARSRAPAPAENQDADVPYERYGQGEPVQEGWPEGLSEPKV